jgi:protoporphyrinogen oxidase
MKIIIIGAGIAGLAAADYLHQQGVKASILEARKRIGGRIHVDHSWGFPISKGASWIHDALNNPLFDLAKQYSCALFRNDLDQSNTYIANGEIIPKQVKNKFNHAIEKTLAQAKHYALNSPHDCSLAEVFKRFWKPESNNPYWQALFNRQLKFIDVRSTNNRKNPAKVRKYLWREYFNIRKLFYNALG